MFAYKDENGNTCVCSRADTHHNTVEIKNTPVDKLFRGAWDINGADLVENLVIAQEISHGKRRDKRDVDFKPFDDVIMKQIPAADHVAAEESRQVIRDGNALIKTDIDAATDIDTLRTIITDNSL